MVKPTRTSTAAGASVGAPERTPAPAAERHPKRPLKRRGAARVISESGPTPLAGAQVVEHPDGWYWAASAGGRRAREFGPYPSRAAALAAALTGDDETPTEGESLQEAESELGISDWIDPDTGEPAPSGRLPSHDER